MLARLWPELALDEAEFQAFIAAFPTELAPHHIARTDALLWRGDGAEAQRMLPLLPAGWQALARARIALRAERDGVDPLIAALPAALASDPGLAYDRFHWRIRKGRTDDALQLLLERSASAADLGQPARWAGWRTYLARSLMRDGRAAQAYMAASSHHLPSGSAYAELEWLSGYIALRYLGDAALARDHFQRLRSAVSTPISLGRAGYWIGRAQEALGNPDAARRVIEKLIKQDKVIVIGGGFSSTATWAAISNAQTNKTNSLRDILWKTGDRDTLELHRNLDISCS